MVNDKKITRWWPLIICLILAGVYAGYFSWFTVTRHHLTNSSRFDLGNVEQVIWNFTHGHGFTMTDPYGTAQVSRLSFHADFFLILLAPWYALFPFTETLIILQTLFIASAVVPIYYLSQRWFKKSVWGILLCLVYLLNPGLQWANIFDVHAVTFATPLIIWTVWLAVTKRFWWAVIIGVATLLTKENVGLSLAAIGLYWLLIAKQRRWGWIFIAGPLIWSIAMWWLIPHWQAATQAQGEVYQTVFGHQASQIAAGIIKHPLTFIKILVAQQNLHYLVQLIIPGGLTSLFSPWSLAAAPDYVINAISLKPAQHLIISHYPSVINGWLTVGSIAGLAYVVKRIKRLRQLIQKIIIPGVVIIIIFCLSYSVWADGPLPGARHDQSRVVRWRNIYAQPVRFWEQAISSSAAVSVTNNIGSHFAKRQKLYSFPLGVAQADYVVVLEDHATPVVASQSEVTGQISALRQSPAWQTLEHHGDLTVLKRH